MHIHLLKTIVYNYQKLSIQNFPCIISFNPHSLLQRNCWHIHLGHEAQRHNSFAAKLRSGRIWAQAAWLLCWALSSSPSALLQSELSIGGVHQTGLWPHLGHGTPSSHQVWPQLHGGGTLRLLGYSINNTRKSKRKDKIELSQMPCGISNLFWILGRENK